MLEFMIETLSGGLGAKVHTKRRWETVLNYGALVLLAVCVVLWFLYPCL